ncbi:MAG: transcriptional repressor [Gammaproteobacteria bacterium]
MAILFSNAAEDMIRHRSARVTTARVQVLAALLKAGRALTHHEIESRLSRTHAIDRVTIYRVLEWLTRQRFAHKIPGDDRVWRFNVADEEHAGQHAHFKCNCCDRVFCLKDTGNIHSVKLPSGYRAQQLELTVKGLCAECLPGNKLHKLSANKKPPCKLANYPQALGK